MGTEADGATTAWRRRAVTWVIAGAIALWVGLALLPRSAGSILVHGQVRRFDGPTLGVGTRCRNVPSLAGESIAVRDADGRVVAETLLDHVRQFESSPSDVPEWTCRQDADFRVRVPASARYSVELGGYRVQPPPVSGRDLRARGGAYSMVFSLLDPQGDNATGCLRAVAAYCPP